MNIKLFFQNMQASSKVEVISIDGQVLLSQELNPFNPTLNISELAKGNYKVRIRGQRSIYTTKLVRK